jgi:type IV pilus assembly protein PilA
METPAPAALPPTQTPGAPRAPSPTSGLDTASLFLGIVSLIGGFFLLVPPLLAVVFGHLSLSQTKKNPALGGRGMGIAGLVMGYVAVLSFLIFAVGLFAAMSIPAFQKVRVASQDKAILNNARQLAAAADQYFMVSGKTAVALGDIVGPQKYVKSLRIVDHERYPVLLEQGHEIIVVKKDGTTMRLNP